MKPSTFNKVELRWEEKTYRIPPDEVLMCIAEIEDVITLSELLDAASNKNLPLAKLARAMGVALRFAGANVSDEEVYDKFFREAGAEMLNRAADVTFALHSLMVPPEHMRAAEEKVRAAEGKKDDGGAADANPASSSSATS